eukprot:6910313-Pyramimonas_sp.AAC.1
MTMRAECFGVDPPRLVSSDLGFSLEVVRQQKCLGAMIQDNGSIAAELHLRCTATLGAIRPVRKVIAPRRQLPIAKKVLYSEALGASRLLYAASVWPSLTCVQYNKVRKAHEGIYRAALKLP